MSTDRVLVTCDSEMERAAAAELRSVMPDLPPGEWIDTGDAIEGAILLVDPPMPFEAFAAAAAGTVFLRHFAPVQREVSLSGTPEDVPLLLQAVRELAGSLAPGRTFAVQTRIVGEGKLPYRKVTVNEALSQALEEQTGAVMECRRPETVVSVLCTAEKGYVGISRTEGNRSAWPGGKHRFRREDGQVSRAEFKLLEAVDVFGLRLPERGRALDMGASPGGWTRILADAGLQVFAVDPADLDLRLRGRPDVEHVRSRIQEFLPRSGRFDVIVNDIKMDARASVQIMREAGTHLAPGGLAVMTLKMPRLPVSAAAGRKMLGMVHENLRHLSEVYEVIGARQLYHNRSEVTVALRAPQGQGRPGIPGQKAALPAPAGKPKADAGLARSAKDFSGRDRRPGSARSSGR